MRQSKKGESERIKYVGLAAAATSAAAAESGQSKKSATKALLEVGRHRGARDNKEMEYLRCQA